MKNLPHNLINSLYDNFWFNLWSNLWNTLLSQDIPWDNALTENSTRGILSSLRRSLE